MRSNEARRTSEADNSGGASEGLLEEHVRMTEFIEDASVLHKTQILSIE
jgi:hypothetical protein